MSMSNASALTRPSPTSASAANTSASAGGASFVCDCCSRPCPTSRRCELSYRTLLLQSGYNFDAVHHPPPADSTDEAVAPCHPAMKLGAEEMRRFLRRASELRLEETQSRKYAPDPTKSTQPPNKLTIGDAMRMRIPPIIVSCHPMLLQMSEWELRQFISTDSFLAHLAQLDDICFMEMTNLKHSKGEIATGPKVRRRKLPRPPQPAVTVSAAAGPSAATAHDDDGESGDEEEEVGEDGQKRVRLPGLKPNKKQNCCVQVISVSHLDSLSV